MTTENAALAARLAAVDIEIRSASATVLLVRALGGDWRKPTVASAPGAPGVDQPG